MSEPVTMLGIATTAEELEKSPDPTDLEGIDADARVPWSVRWQSAGVGFLIGLVIGTVLLTFMLIGRGEWWPLPLALLSGATLVVVLRASSGLDARWVVGVASAVLVALSVAPLPGQVFGSSTVLGIAALVMAVVFVKVWTSLTRLRADVVDWNHAYARLAESAQRADVVGLTVDAEEHGDQHRFVGKTTYVADDGLERTVPFVSAEHLRMYFPAGIVISERSAAVVWHTPDHAVVHTMVLRDRV